MRDTTVRVCGVCARVLDTRWNREHTEIIGWEHVYNPDKHVVVPVQPDEVQMEGHCDFCHAPGPQFEVPARDFEMPDDVPGTGSRGHWACCGECAVLVERKDWDGVVERADKVGHVRTHGRRMGSYERQVVRRMYRYLRRNITGPVRPLTWPPTREE